MSKPARFKAQATKPDKGWTLNIPARFSATGKRERRYFKKKTLFDAAAADLRARAEKFGQSSAMISPSAAEDATAALAMLRPWNMSLVEAARIVAGIKQAESDSSELGDAVEAWLAECKASLRTKTITGYKYLASRLVAALGEDTLLTSISRDALIAAIMPPGTPTTSARGYVRAGKTFWRWAANQGWCDASIVSNLKLPKATNGAAEIELLTTAEAEHLLRTAETHHPEIVAHYALALFAGVRAEEIARLTAKDVSPDGIELTAEITKKGRRRHITPNATLAAWLVKYPFAPIPQLRRIDATTRFHAGYRVRPMAGVVVNDTAEEYAARPAWPQNAMRHSHASYAVANGESVDALLFQFGHVGSTAMLREHYVGRASAKAAKQFYQILPR